MRTRIALALLCFLATGVGAIQPAAARNTRYELKIADVKQDHRYAENVPGDVVFFFAGQTAPKPTTILGEYVTNRKTNSFGRPDEEACRWAMISALKELHDRALEEGGNAVINIVSYYKKNTFASETLYECHAGAIVAGVALKGTVIKIDK